MAAPRPLIAVRGSRGVAFHKGQPDFAELNEFQRDTTRSCRVIAFSKDGKLFAWSNEEKVQVVALPSFEKVLEVPKPKTLYLDFSPKGNILCTWEQYTGSKDSQEQPNMFVYDIKSKKCLRSFVQKKQSSWQPQWSDDESICARSMNNEVHIYESNNFETFCHKIHLQKLAEFSLAPGDKPYHIACHVPGTKGQPSFVRAFRHPNYEGPSAGIANKSFYKADKVDFRWNKKGTGLLLLTSTDVDKTGASYYGDQGLHFLRTNGDTAMVKRGKDGPVYSVEWSPECDHFCVVYGFMPAKATLFNLNCDPVFDMGTGPRNSIYYNIQGTLLILAGFGNLRGNVEVWDVKGRKQVSRSQASDSTQLCWCADGEHYLTATTAPRLRVGNGYKVWHYSGSLQHENICCEGEELWDVLWQPCPAESFPAKPISYKQVSGIQSSQPQASKQVYRPPGARGQPSSFKVKDDESASTNKAADSTPKSKTAIKNQKRKEAKKAKKENAQPAEVTDKASAIQTVVEIMGQNSAPQETEEGSREKKIRNLKKKLGQIATLKEEVQAGKKLEANQLEKIKREQELLDELEALELH
ncbi:eukaryotic translation initiation factor 2A [Rhipicephalus microplus]|uniref:eukaryotic translation initiation factor 2A n=1 Tax=Rhipicephalus microplus TaxID=6941 RepID=UPI003F6C0329